MLLGLDVSTSTIGVSLFDLNGNLIKVSHYEPKVKDKNADQMKKLWLKAHSFELELLEQFEEYIGEIQYIFIEEPLKNSANPNTAAMLNRFSGFIYDICYNVFQVFPRYITVDDSRRKALPELVGKRINEKTKKESKTASLWGPIPLKIGNTPLSKLRKHIILSLVSQRFPEVTWLLNRNLTIDKKNFDRADSIVVALAGLLSLNLIEADPQDINKAIKFCKENVRYEESINNIKTSQEYKEFSSEQKAIAKTKYLTEVFMINKHLNIGY